MDIKKLLGIRKELKSKKPEFIRQDQHKKAKLQRKWQRPKGLHSKMRRNKKGRRKSVRMGYSSPALVRGMHHKGLRAVFVSNVNDLLKITPAEEGALIKKVGQRKKAGIIKKALEMEITLLNIGNPEEWLRGMEDQMNKRKSERAETKTTKEAKAKEKAKKEKEAEQGIEKKLSEPEEDKKTREKQEKDKILIKK